MRFHKKYEPLKVVIYNILGGFLVLLVLSILNGGLTSKDREMFFDISLIAFLIGIIYCEVSYYIKNEILGSIIFSFLSVHTFLLMLMILIYVNSGEIQYFTLYDYGMINLIFTTLLSVIYYGIKNDKFK